MRESPTVSTVSASCTAHTAHISSIARSGGEANVATMSVAEMYRLAHRVRDKLAREATSPNQQMRLLVGHANLLDMLVDRLNEANFEEDDYLEETSVAAATHHRDLSDSDSDTTESDTSESDTTESGDGSAEEDEEAQYEAQADWEREPSRLLHDAAPYQHTGRRTRRKVTCPHFEHQPPELECDDDGYDSDSDSDGPESPTFELPPPLDDDDFPPAGKGRQETKEVHESLFSDDYCLPPRSPARLGTYVPLFYQ